MGTRSREKRMELGGAWLVTGWDGGKPYLEFAFNSERKCHTSDKRVIAAIGRMIEWALNGAEKEGKR